MVLLVAHAGVSHSQEKLPPLRVDGAVEHLGREFISSDKADALSIAIIQAGDVTFFDFGSAVHGGSASPKKSSVYEIGSLTKLFTSLLLAHAVREGRIGLHDDIRRYLPGQYPNLAWNGTPVRVIDLADTTSALPDNPPNYQEVTAQASEQKKAFVLARALDGYSPQDMLRDLHSSALVGKPGVQPRHSNLAANLLGYILTRIYGVPFDTLLQQKIQQPLKLVNGVRADDPKCMVQGYDAHHMAMPATNQSAVLAAGGLRYSTADMAKFLQAEMTANDPAIRLTQVPAFGTADTGAVGFNWQISRNTEGLLKLNASGETLGSASYVELYPERGYGVVVLANRSGTTESLLYGFADALFGVVVGTPALDALKIDLDRTHYVDVSSSVQSVRRRFPRLSLSEAYVNNWGGGLLGTDPRAALALFQYNVRRWPRSSDAFDSLGEGYAQAGNKAEALKSYRQALVLNPDNKEAADSLASLLSLPSTK